MSFEGLGELFDVSPAVAALAREQLVGKFRIFLGLCEDDLLVLEYNEGGYAGQGYGEASNVCGGESQHCGACLSSLREEPCGHGDFDLWFLLGLLDSEPVDFDCG